MILFDLAMVAREVHDHDDEYCLFRRQCFWYSDAIVGVLEQYFDIKVDTADRSLDADHAEDAEMEVFDNVSGTYMRIPIYSRRISLIAEIHDSFAKCKADTQTLVSL